MTIAELTAQAGPVGWILIGISFVAAALASGKALQIIYWRWRGSAWTQHPVACLRAAVLAAELDTASAARRDERIHAEFHRQMHRVEWGTGALAGIAQLSPLIGLLGTVLGMILAFSQLETAGGRPDPAVLAGGIWQALLTTAMGLAVAIPSRAVVYALDAEANRLAHDLRDAACVMEANDQGHEPGKERR